MNNNKLSIIKTIVFIACALSVGSAIADVSSDRIDTYKSNKLLPNEVQIATVNSVASDSAGVAVFSSDSLSWNSYSNAISASVGKFLDWTKADFEAFFADSSNAPDFEEAWNALSQFGNDHLQGAVISDEDALAVLQAQLNRLCNNGTLSGKSFPCEGLDFSGLFCDSMDLSKCTGLSAEQFFSMPSKEYCTLPAIDFTNTNFAQAGQLRGVDLSKCTGLTANQLFSTSGIVECILPAIDFTGVSFAGKDLYGVDFSKCSGISSEQLKEAANITYIRLTQEQFDLVKDDFPTDCDFYVDGKLMNATANL